MPPIGYPGNSITKEARAKAGGGFESAIENAAPQSLTLTGSGFEAISNPRPTAYDNFNEYSGLGEGDQIPDDVETFGFSGDGIRWTQRSNFADNNPPRITTVNALPGREFCMFGNRKWHTGKALPQSNGPARSATSHYHTYFFAANESLRSPPQPVDARSDKWHRTWATDNFRVSFEPGRGEQAEPNGDGRLAIEGVFFYPYTGAAEATPNVFHQIEEWIIGDQLWISINGKKSGPYAYPKSSSAFAAEVIYTELIGHDVSQPDQITSTLETYNAEFYEQPNCARVLLSNNATYDDSVEQRRFYQLCTSRTDSEIVIPEPFFGDLDTGSAIYAHIVKSDGSVINYGQVN